MFERVESFISLLKKSKDFIKLLKVDLELIAGLFVVNHEFLVILCSLGMCLLHVLCVAMINMTRWVYLDCLRTKQAIYLAHLFTVLK